MDCDKCGNKKEYNSKYGIEMCVKCYKEVYDDEDE